LVAYCTTAGTAPVPSSKEGKVFAAQGATYSIWIDRHLRWRLLVVVVVVIFTILFLQCNLSVTTHICTSTITIVDTCAEALPKNPDNVLLD